MGSSRDRCTCFAAAAASRKKHSNIAACKYRRLGKGRGRRRGGRRAGGCVGCLGRVIAATGLARFGSFGLGRRHFDLWGQRLMMPAKGELTGGIERCGSGYACSRALWASAFDNTRRLMVCPWSAASRRSNTRRLSWSACSEGGQQGCWLHREGVGCRGRFRSKCEAAGEGGRSCEALEGLAVPPATFGAPERSAVGTGLHPAFYEQFTNGGGSRREAGIREKRRRRRGDSGDDVCRHDSSDEADDGNGSVDAVGRAKRMSPGHRSGLQNASDFAAAERKLRKRQRRELGQHNTKNSGDGRTVYLDKSGRRGEVNPTADEAELARTEREREERQSGSVE
ncbi:hypothetical protein THAOC_36603 [Thalassiosira oceanica]|uniref:Uncharacterized protein n=1 Tax=Thalassiosira oceanica TaxID=159749 RepID=K0QZ83_THAOC|nr:hypothetical protein THAOC_36603 [Thalassiosira oceanica]|eukprot:EJK44828.1 hypothetical protein THAOC_36603 [Thalassiosira oceanica]